MAVFLPSRRLLVAFIVSQQCLSPSLATYWRERRPAWLYEEENNGGDISARCVWQDELTTSNRRRTLSWLSTEWSRLQQCYSSRSVNEGDFSWDLCPFNHRFSCVNSLRCRHISNTYRVSCVCPGPGRVFKEPVLDASFQLHDGTLLGSQRQSRKVGESEQRRLS